MTPFTAMQGFQGFQPASHNGVPTMPIPLLPNASMTLSYNFDPMHINAMNMQLGGNAVNMLMQQPGMMGYSQPGIMPRNRDQQQPPHIYPANSHYPATSRPG